MQPGFHSRGVIGPLSAFLRLAMMGCSALRARGELAVGACAPVLGWDRGGSSSAGARAWWGAWGTGARGPSRFTILYWISMPFGELREVHFDASAVRVSTHAVENFETICSVVLRDFAV